MSSALIDDEVRPAPVLRDTFTTKDLLDVVEIAAEIREVPSQRQTTRPQLEKS
jgi:hypothetical protein